MHLGTAPSLEPAEDDNIVRELLHDFDAVSQPYHSAQEDVSLYATSIDSSSPTRRLSLLGDSHNTHSHSRTAGPAVSPPPSFHSAHLFADLDPPMESFEAPQRRKRAHQEPHGMAAMSRMNAPIAARMQRTPLDPIAEQGLSVPDNSTIGTLVHSREKQIMLNKHPLDPSQPHEPHEPTEHELERQAAEEMLHQVGNLDGSWELEELLGMGGLSNVFSAKHLRVKNRMAAIKITKNYITQGNKNSPPYYDKKVAINGRLKEDHCFSTTVLEYTTYQKLHARVLPHGQALPPPTAASSAKRKYGAIQGSTDPQNRSKVRKVTVPHGTGQGALPLAYGYGFVELPVEDLDSKRLHGWISMEMLGWNLHSVSTADPGIDTWHRFYQVPQAQENLVPSPVYDSCSQLASGMLAAVEKLHLRGLVHRDVKPANFCLGKGPKCNVVYLVDFGFVTDLPTKGDRMEDSFCGTPDFAGTGALRGLRCGAKDDCESLAYSFLQLWNDGRIPWSIVPSPHKHRSINRDSKGNTLGICDTDSMFDCDSLGGMLEVRNIIYEEMKEDGKIPPFIQSWLLYLSSIQVWQLPDYSLLQDLLSRSYMHWVDYAPRKPREKHAHENNARKLHAVEE